MSYDIDRAELRRYIEYLQRELLTPDTDLWHRHEHYQSWAATGERAALDPLVEQYGEDAVSEFRTLIEEFEPGTAYDTLHSREIFAPLLEAVHETAIGLGVATTRPVIVANSTDAAPSPVSRPSSDVHLVFAGAGTFAFCNYWGKVLARFADTVARCKPRLREPTSLRDIDLALAIDPEVVSLASRLSIYYALARSVVGFGTVNYEDRLIPFRAECVTAMEVFAIAHEYGHCFAEERFEQLRGRVDSSKSQELEHICDLIGGSISQEYGGGRDLWSAYCNAGAVLLLRSHDLCEQVADVVGKRTATRGRDTHPPTEARLKLIKGHTLRKTPDDQKDGVQSYIADLEQMLARLHDVVLDLVASVMARTN